MLHKQLCSQKKFNLTFQTLGLNERASLGQTMLVSYAFADDLVQFVSAVSYRPQHATVVSYPDNCTLKQTRVLVW